MTHPNQVVRDGALRVLFALDMMGAKPGEDLTQRIDRTFALVEELEPGFGDRRADIVERVEAIFGSWTTINEEIQAVSPNWRVERMSVVDRNILRMGCWELEGGEEPPAVVIDASVELGKRFGATETSGFVNGLLEEYCETHGLTMRD